MTLRSIFTRTATIALAAAALAAPTASARPADMPPSVAKTTAAAQDQQDMRSADVIDAATRQKQNLRSADAAEYPTRPAQGEQANPRPDTTPTATAERGIAWATIGIGIAGSLLAIGTIAAIASRTRRTGRPRITA